MATWKQGSTNLYTPNSKKVALGIGNWEAIVWAYENNEMLCLSDRQTIASQCPIANARSNLF